MTERRSATSVRLWAFISVMGLVFVLWFFFFRPFGDGPNTGGTAEPSLGSYEQTYDPKPRTEESALFPRHG